MTLSFHGATGTVTGSRFLVATPDSRVLVDAGLFQGLRQLRRRNWDPVPFDAAGLDAVVVSHAHLDHTGYLPALGRSGLTAPIIATPDTARLAELVLRDSAKLQEEDAAYAASKGFSKHENPKPLYDGRDVDRVLPLFEPVDFDERARARHGPDNATAGPPGTSSARHRCCSSHRSGRSLFSGDLGRSRPPTAQAS